MLIFSHCFLPILAPCGASVFGSSFRKKKTKKKHEKYVVKVHDTCKLTQVIRNYTKTIKKFDVWLHVHSPLIIIIFVTFPLLDGLVCLWILHMSTKSQENPPVNRCITVNKQVKLVVLFTWSVLFSWTEDYRMWIINTSIFA